MKIMQKIRNLKNVKTHQDNWVKNHMFEIRVDNTFGLFLIFKLIYVVNIFILYLRIIENEPKIGKVNLLI